MRNTLLAATAALGLAAAGLAGSSHADAHVAQDRGPALETRQQPATSRIWLTQAAGRIPSAEGYQTAATGGYDHMRNYQTAAVSTARQDASQQRESA